MKKYIYTLAALVALASAPAFSGTDNDHATSAEAESSAVPAHGHGGPQDDHSKIKALDVTPEEAVVVLETQLTKLWTKAEASAKQDVIAQSLSMMSAVKTLRDASPNDRQVAALKQLDEQLDGAKHAAEDGNFDKAKSSITKAKSALKLYKAMK